MLNTQRTCSVVKHRSLVNSPTTQRWTDVYVSRGHHARTGAIDGRSDGCRTCSSRCRSRAHGRSQKALQLAPMQAPAISRSVCRSAAGRVSVLSENIRRRCSVPRAKLPATSPRLGASLTGTTCASFGLFVGSVDPPPSAPLVCSHRRSRRVCAYHSSRVVLSTPAFRGDPTRTRAQNAQAGVSWWVIPQQALI